MIHPDLLHGEPAAVTEKLKQHVSYALLTDPDAPFRP
jgi:hypothetical protein